MHFKPLSRTVTGSALVLAFALSSCGSSNPATSSSSTSASTTSQASTSKSSAAVPTHPQLHTPAGGNLKTTIKVSSPAISADLALDRNSTCDGADTSPAITWSNLPANTTQIAIFVITAGSVQGQLGQLGVNWGVANLDASTNGIPAGKPPAGAVVGVNSEGKRRYSVCPAKGQTGNFAVLVYALKHRISLKPGFDASTAREQVAGQALAGGVLVSHYQRH